MVDDICRRLLTKILEFKDSVATSPGVIEEGATTLLWSLLAALCHPSLRRQA